MYTDLAPWFPLLTPPEEYVEEAAEVRRLLEGASTPLETVLELGAGGGHLASNLGGDLRLTLTDLSEDMLASSRRLNPSAEHVRGDMRVLRLGKTFDAVLVHDAIGYMTSEADLRAAFETAYVHLRAGGAALFVPDWVLDTFRPHTEHGGADRDGRAIRFLEWDRDLEPDGHTVITDFVILTHDVDGSVGIHHDEHRLGIFPRATWLGLLAAVGFDARRTAGDDGRDMFLGTRQA